MRPQPPTHRLSRRRSAHRKALYTERTRGRLLVAMVVLAVALALVLLAMLVVRKAPREQATDVRKAYSGAGLVIRAPPGWSVARPRAIEGFSFTRPLALVDDTRRLRLLAGLLPVTSHTLLPAEVLGRRSRWPSRPRRMRMGGRYDALVFSGLEDPVRKNALDVYAVPTTAGVATIVCSATDTMRALLSECGSVAASLEVTAGEPVVLGRHTAFRMRLDGVVDELNSSRSRARRVLRLTVLPSGASQAATRLASVHERGASALTPLVPPRSRVAQRLVAVIAGSGRALRALADALRAGNGGAVRAARSKVLRLDARLRRALAAYPHRR